MGTWSLRELGSGHPVDKIVARISPLRLLRPDEGFLGIFVCICVEPCVCRVCYPIGDSSCFRGLRLCGF